jgi:hypothetical protein
MSYANHDFYTHQPFLIEVLRNTTGDVLECGCGDGSTLIIKKELKDTQRALVTVESNLQWLSKFTNLRTATHELHHVPAGTSDSVETGMMWVGFLASRFASRVFDVVFIDSSPWMSRKAVFDYYKSKTRVVVIHDFDYFPNNGLIGRTISTERVDGKEKIECDLSGEVKHYKLYYPPYSYFVGKTGPPTLVCSDTMTAEEFASLTSAIDAAVPAYYTLRNS